MQIKIKIQSKKIQNNNNKKFILSNPQTNFHLSQVTAGIFVSCKSQIVFHNQWTKEDLNTGVIDWHQS